ncbi:MAG: hypothetical protein BroJett031_15020 [Betaproteobacteria bacterium]|nr:MAG: hypothetical protein BroJett031_15020 [Betaproteobacteria bacterium]
MNALRFGAAAAAAALAGCVVFPYGPYWKPEASGGEYARAWCGEQVGPYNKVRLRLNEQVRATLTIEEKPQRHVSVLFEAAVEPLAVGAKARLESGGRRLEVPVKLSDWAIERGVARVATDGAVFTPTGKPAVGRIEVALPPEIDSRFTFHFPRLTHGDRPLAAPPVKWERRVFDGGVQPLNC